MAPSSPPPPSASRRAAGPELGGMLTEAGDDLAAPARKPAPKLERGDEIGRYVILGRVGAGGMGVVYAAWDPKLDRKVALKLLLSDKPDHGQRLEREAQAMARLTHPNVIAVHDVGEVDGRVFMAMEFVDGETLTRWAAGEREWPALLEVLLDAGRGLAAAHAQGLVHRDFKPDNVMIGDDGRVRVMDFGLVRASEPGVEAAASNARLAEPSVAAFLDQLGSMDSSALDSQITHAGSLLGTPAYMAPEQLRGEESNARSDQFAYCITAWQCLYGARPFAGDSPLAVLFSITEGNFAEPPGAPSVPARVRRALERGLADDASARWPSMDALLAALVDDPASRRRPWVLAAGSVAVALAAASAAILLEPATPTAPCAQAGREIDENWSALREAQIAARFADSSLAYASETWAHVNPRLASWAGDWAAARRDTCEATQVRHEQSSELLDLRMACLDQRRGRFRALVEVLVDADDTVIEKAIEASEGLPALEPCSDRAWLLSNSRPPEDPELAAAVAALRVEVDTVSALTDAGKGAEQLARITELDARAQALGWDSLLAESAIARAQVEQELGQFEATREALERAFFAARRSGHDEATISSAFLLTYVYGVGLAQFDEAQRWAAHALAEAERVGDPRLLAQVHIGIGILHYMHSELDAAEAAFAKALALQEVEESTELAMANINYGTVIVRGNPERAKEAFAALDLGLAMLERQVGSRHPVIAMTMSNYATVYEEVGRHEEAVALFGRALAINLAAAGPEHPFTGLIELNMAKSLVSVASDEALALALSHATNSAKVHRAAYGERHLMVARSEQVTAKAKLALGREREALAHVDVATDIATELFGAGHAEVVRLAVLRARALRALGELSDARKLLEEILAGEISDAKLRADAQLELEQLDHS